MVAFRTVPRITLYPNVHPQAITIPLWSGRPWSHQHLKEARKLVFPGGGGGRPAREDSPTWAFGCWALGFRLKKKARSAIPHPNAHSSWKALGCWALGFRLKKKARSAVPQPNAQCPMPNAHSCWKALGFRLKKKARSAIPHPKAQSPKPNAQCPMPNAPLFTAPALLSPSWTTCRWRR